MKIIKKSFFKRKLVWVVLILLIWWLFNQCIRFFFKPEIIIENKTDHIFYASYLQTPRWGDFDYDEYKKSLIDYKIKPNGTQYFSPELHKMIENDFVYFYVDWREHSGNTMSSNSVNFLLHAPDNKLFTEYRINEKKPVERHLVSVFPNKTACRFRIIISGDGYTVIPENKWFCFRKMTLIRDIQ